MVRECIALTIVAFTPACSLILNFDEKPPADASFDAPYTQAECDYMEPNDDIASAMMITAADMGPAAICKPAMSGGAEDHDYYKFTAMSASIVVSIAFTNRPGGDIDIKVEDSAGALMGQSRGFGDGETLTCPGTSPSCMTLTPGTDYYLHVLPAVPGSVNNYTFSVMP
jgi:hypothetical protein